MNAPKYLTEVEARKWRDHYDETIEKAMKSIAASERSLKKTAIGILTVVITVSLAWIGFSIDSKVRAQDSQEIIDTKQDADMKSIMNAVHSQAIANERSAVLLQGHLEQSNERRAEMKEDAKRNEVDLRDHMQGANQHR